MKQELRRGVAAFGVAIIAMGLACCDRSERDAARWLDLEIVVLRWLSLCHRHEQNPFRMRTD